MIRIDELYNNTFWPFVQRNVAHTRMFYCDPPGRTDPNNLFNFGADRSEKNYIFFHDQEPVHRDLHDDLFQAVTRRNKDLRFDQGALHAALITSEYCSTEVDHVCSQYHWQPYYYFFHGWAALDWYRGYHRTFLIQDPADRKIRHSFIAPNRIVGGRRHHRLLLMYLLLTRQVKDALISFPRHCPQEQQDVLDISIEYQDRYPGITHTLEAAQFPWNFANEQGHPMHSCWLSLFDECAQTLAYVVTETLYFGQRLHLTEKTFKPICLGMPFVMVSCAGSLEYLRSFGFQTFGTLWDESYDQETDDFRRLERIADLLAYLDGMDRVERHKMYQRALPIVRHNHQHFYGGGFEQRLWQELTHMLSEIQQDFQ